MFVHTAEGNKIHHVVCCSCYPFKSITSDVLTIMRVDFASNYFTIMARWKTLKVQKIGDYFCSSVLDEHCNDELRVIVVFNFNALSLYLLLKRIINPKNINTNELKL